MVPIRRIQPLGDLAIGAFQPARFHRDTVEFRRPAAIDPPPVPGSDTQPFLVTRRLRAAVRPRFPAHPAPSSAVASGVESARKWLGWRGGMIVHAKWREPSMGPPAQQICRFGKPLEEEIYVASEASANAASQLCTAKQLFGPAGRFPALGLREHRCYPALTSRCRLCRDIRPRGNATKHSFRRNFIMTQVDHIRYGQRDSRASHGCRREGEIRPSRPAEGARDIATVLFTQFLKFDAAESAMADSRPLHSVGRPHGSMLLVRLAVSDRQYRHGRSTSSSTFRLVGESLNAGPSGIPHQGHRDHGGTARPGIATSVGFELAEKMLAAPSTARKLSTITPMCSPPTATVMEFQAARRRIEPIS